ncbi:hypothetical protein N7540_001654 [Penicillium herquei]|nr:hypothetical protein N7540_001654 [Penicillium herquei]
MATNSPPDYQKLWLEEKKKREYAEELVRPTAFMELLSHCHNLFSLGVKAASPSKSTQGSVNNPNKKLCPIRLRPWTECNTQQQDVYNRVCHYLQPTTEVVPQLFHSSNTIQEIAPRYVGRPISSEQGLENYEKNCVEGYVGSVISELCQIPAAHTEFMLGKGVYFDDHPNALTETHQAEAADQSKSSDPKPYHFCIHEFNDGTNNLILVAEYKPPHKLSVENLLAGLQPMELYEQVVKRNTIPTEPTEKLQYNAELLTASALVQIYDAMIEKGREYGVLTNGMARVLLWVPSDDPATIFYHLCDPNSEMFDREQHVLQQPITSIARLLCLCLMGIRSPTRNQEWRDFAASEAKRWETSFNRAHSSIPIEELHQSPLRSDSSTGYEPYSPLEHSTTDRRVKTRSQTQAGCDPSNAAPQRTPSTDSSGSDSNQTMARKRGFSQVTSSPSTQRVARQRESSNNQSNQERHRDAKFCSQRCLMGLQAGDNLDEACPNVELHRRGHDCTKHLITSENLVLCLKEEFDENIDRCIPIGGCGSYGAPFKLTYLDYGYTVIGKGTTSDLWDHVSREVQVYQILRKAQGSAVPVFLGTIDLAKTYHLDGAGPIKHMLVMGFAGERTATMDLTPELRREIKRSQKEIESLGIIHDDLRRENVLWCEELKRALIIDFHGATLKSRPSLQEPKTKRRFGNTDKSDAKRLRV